jgi:hypothetical protein
MSVGDSYFYRIVATNAGVDSSQSTPKGLTVTAPRVHGSYSRSDNKNIRQAGLIIDGMFYYATASSTGTSALITPWQTLSPGTYTVRTAATTSTSTSWNPNGTNRGTQEFKVFHSYTISINTGKVLTNTVSLGVK